MIKFCPCKISGSFNTSQSMTVVEPHQNFHGFIHYALPLSCSAPQTVSCTTGTSQNKTRGVLLHFRDTQWGARPGMGALGHFPCVTTADRDFPSDTYSCVQTLCVFKAHKGKQVRTQIDRPAQSSSARLERKVLSS